MKIDLSSHAFAQNPYPFYDELRKTGNVHYLENNNLWLVIGYQEAVDCLKDVDTFTSESEYSFDPILLNCDPPIHTKHKKILGGTSGPFAQTRIDILEQQNRAIFNSIAQPLLKSDSFDVMNDLAVPFSSFVILNLLGIKPTSIDELKNWSKNAILSESIFNSQLATSQWNKLKPHVEQWVSESRDKGLNTGFGEVMFHKDASHLTDDKLVDLVKVLLLGGNETTPNLVSSAFLILLQNQHLRESLMQDPSLLSDFIFEVLRIEAPTQIIQRTTKKDITIGNKKITKGSTIGIAIGAANRDPEHFVNPNQFDLKRSKGKILSFGFGPHYCLGAHLAKQEAQIVLEALLINFAEMVLPDNFKPKYRNSSHVRGIQSLPVYTARAKNKIALNRSIANELLITSLNKYNHFPSLENYPKIDPEAWHYTFPSPFIHANVMYALQNLNDKNYSILLQKGTQFLLQQKDVSDTWRFWKVNECRNPVPPDIDDTSICSKVLAREGTKLLNKELIYENIKSNGDMNTWIIPSFSKLLKFPRLVYQTIIDHNKISKTLNANMLHADDFEIGVMANALLYLGENEKTQFVIDRCIQLWQTKTDHYNFYDNDLVIAFHLARAYHSGIKSFHVLQDDIINQVNTYPFHQSLCESTLAHLIAIYFNNELLIQKTKIDIIKNLDSDQPVFAPYKYFTSKDRNFYGGSDCLTAAWFLEATQNW